MSGSLLILLTSMLTIVMLLSCTLIGHSVFSRIKVSSPSIGTSFILGYAILGVLLILSLKCFDSFAVGEILFLCLIFWFIYSFFKNDYVGSVHGNHKWSLPSLKELNKKGVFNKWNILLFLILISWTVVVLKTYMSLLWFPAGVRYYFPHIYDLPKHIFAIFSLYQTEGWPPSNPFFSGEHFAYNFLFYIPVAAAARIIKTPLAMYVTFPLLVISIALAIPLVILDITKRISKSRAVQLFAVLTATWVGGLTPIWTNGLPPTIGPVLLAENLVTSVVWIEEIFIYVIFIPQHIFSVLCGLITAYILAGRQLHESSHLKILIAGTLILAAMLSSLPLIPVLSLSYFILVFWYLIAWKRDRNIAFWSSQSLSMILIAVLPFMMVFPFLLEIMAWTKNTASMLTKPVLSSQWFYIATTFGLIVPFGLYGAYFIIFKRRHLTGSFPLESALGILTLVGIFFMVFGVYLDVGLKFALWVRLTLVPVAAYGLSKFLNAFAEKQKIRKMILILLSVCMVWIWAINFPTVKYFIKYAKIRTTESFRQMTSYIRSLPADARIALFTPDQAFAATMGRQIDFDFRNFREDSYMPVEGRLRANKFWDGIASGSPEAWSNLIQRYDYLIVADASVLNTQFAKHFKRVQKEAGFSIYKNLRTHLK